MCWLHLLNRELPSSRYKATFPLIRSKDFFEIKFAWNSVPPQLTATHFYRARAPSWNQFKISQLSHKSLRTSGLWICWPKSCNKLTSCQVLQAHKPLGIRPTDWIGEGRLEENSKPERAPKGRLNIWHWDGKRLNFSGSPQKSQRNRRCRLICNLHNRVLLRGFEKRIFLEVYRKYAQQVAEGKKEEVCIKSVMTPTTTDFLSRHYTVRVAPAW